MSSFAKMMVWYVVGLPVFVTVMLVLTDVFRGREVGLVSYVPNLLGVATGGIIAGFVMHNVKKLRIDKNEYVYAVMYNWGYGEYVEKERRLLTDKDYKKIDRLLVDEINGGIQCKCRIRSINLWSRSI
ncbi:hypothetical protein JSY36_04970 [Bacillus sp. H-16]|uniref:hypothetical protein n=1 Tax=Alteribacter salitolerans TaxID=2912333 RepID=UPI00196249E8|nr:hypothetical protein [Alteribacter salitolerans]MBM7095104.1 hypothetical protein [Alteribacter salitolerans]